MHRPPRPDSLVCACGNATEMMCFFDEDEPHGVCGKCATVRMLELKTGQTVYRFICNRCWRLKENRSIIIP